MTGAAGDRDFGARADSHQPPVDFTLVMDPRGTILRAPSPSAAVRMGLDPDAFAGRSGYDLVHPDDVADLARAHATVLERREAISCGPYRTLAPNGWLWVESILRPRLDPDSGAVTEIHVLAHDISHRLAVQSKLKRRERQLSEAQRLAKVGSWEWDFDTDTVWWSLQLYEIFGRARGSFRPTFRAYLDHVAQEDRDRVEQIIMRALADRAPFRYECRILRASGESGYIEASGDIVLDPDGRKLVMYGVAQDISRRRESERAMAGMHAELEWRSRELERSNIELEQFAYDAAHEIGDPLRIVSHDASALAELYGAQLDDRGRRLLASIVDGSERMRILIADLLDYSRVSYDSLQRELLDSRLVLDETIRLLQEPITERRATVTARNLPRLKANPTQFRQLFHNLVSNALKFVADEPPRIVIAAARERAAWRFDVRDNGIGVEPHQAARVFELFRRLHPGGDEPGTGIGLSICKRIVERHGGHIWVEPADGGGSVFHFTIPDAAPVPAAAA